MILCGLILQGVGLTRSGKGQEEDMIDLALMTPEVHFTPGLTYTREPRLFQGIPGLERVENGRLWATWYAGGEGEGPRNYCVLVTSPDNAQSWSDLRCVIDPPGDVRAFDPCLWIDPTGKLWFFWAQGYSHWDGRAGVWCMTTDNPGEDTPAWTEPRRLCDGIMMNKPTVLSTGAWLLPVAIWAGGPKVMDERYGHDIRQSTGSAVYVSGDQGVSWSFLGKSDVKERACDEHMLVERRDGSLWKLVRTRYGIGEAFSRDGGETWVEKGPAETVSHIPHARFFIRRLVSGNLLLVKHDPPNRKDRSHLKAFLSKDDGMTWSNGLLLDDRKHVSYPDGVQSRDGTLYIIYDFERTGERKILMAMFTEADVEAGQCVSDLARLRILVNQADPPRAEYVPRPKKVETDLLVGAHHCPLWEPDQFHLWDQVVRYPERTPELGFYSQNHPEVADWETLWASEHGVGFFLYCWYRASQGEPVKMRFGSAIHDALFQSRYQEHIQFAIMWENQARGMAGVEDERDLMEHLLPFWMEHYFKRPNYLKFHNKPLLFVYRPEFLIQDLGGEEQVKVAFQKMRKACEREGFDGLVLLGEYRGLDPNHLQLLKRLGLDYSFAYCWYIHDHPEPSRAIDTQMEYIRKTQELGILPQVVTVSQGWTGWRNEGSVWRIPPLDFEVLLRRAKEFVSTLPEEELGHHMLLLDNWNEWGEGHYLAPHRQYGFGYLDAVRRVFSEAPLAHEDVVPRQIGLGPYDMDYREEASRRERMRNLASKVAVKEGGEGQDLVGWWAFDELEDDPVAMDCSGNRVGGILQGASRTSGVDGNALVCEGGCVIVESSSALSCSDQLTLSCWIRTDEAGQENRWFINRVYGGGENTGYRMGLMSGKPCFEVPLTAWSHHLVGPNPIPLGQWTHVAGTFDGMIMRLYVDGKEIATMERPGKVHANDFHLCLGSYEVNHQSHFKGLLDEVKLSCRAWSAEEVQAEAILFRK